MSGIGRNADSNFMLIKPYRKMIWDVFRDFSWRVSNWQKKSYPKHMSQHHQQKSWSHETWMYSWHLTQITKTISIHDSALQGQNLKFWWPFIAYGHLWRSSLTIYHQFEKFVFCIEYIKIQLDIGYCILTPSWK